jgi:hypothetical protein
MITSHVAQHAVLRSSADNSSSTGILNFIQQTKPTNTPQLPRGSKTQTSTGHHKHRTTSCNSTDQAALLAAGKPTPGGCRKQTSIEILRELLQAKSAQSPVSKSC